MDALFMLEQAEDMISASQQLRAEHEQELHKYRSQIFSASNSEAFRSYIMELKKGKNPEIGYYCEAKAILNNDPDTGRSFAIEIMNEARAKYKLGTKSLSFMIMLYRSDPIFKYNFNTIFELYGELEKKDGFVMRPIDMFRFGVLCYQIERFDEGRERFRVLRSVMRREDIPFVPARDFWRDKISPDKPRETYLKVQRILSEWKGEVLLEEVGQVVPFRPRHFQVLLQVGQVERCGLRFELNGPIAVPTRFLDN